MDQFFIKQFKNSVWNKINNSNYLFLDGDMSVINF